ncbi:ABC transporter substrate-binding protein [Thermodesulfobacteriota bacterium]
MKKFLLITVVCAFAFCSGFIGLTQSAIAADKAKYGGIMKYAYSKAAGVIGDPLGIRGFNHEFIDFVLQTLVLPSNTKLGTFEPELATSWQLTPDKSNYTFKLRKGVKFHDGTAFNAQAVKWNLDRWVKSKRPRLGSVTSIDVIDDYTLKCNLSSWKATGLFDFAKDTFIISPTAFEKNGAEWAKSNPVGTGAFKLVDSKRKVFMKYEKHNDYWQEGLPYLDGVYMNIIPDSMTSLASIKKGDVDAWFNVDSISAQELKASGNFVLSTNPGPHSIMQFNSKEPTSPWSNKKMREALEYALDKATMTKAVGRGFQYPVYEIIHSIPPKAGTTPRKYNPEKARQLMKEAGFGSGLKIKLSHASGAGSVRDMVVAIQANLKDIGIELELEPLSRAAMNELAFKPVVGPNIVMSGQRGGPNELLVSVDETLAPGSVFFQGVQKPEGFDNILEEALSYQDLNKTMNKLYELEKLAYDYAMLVPVNGVLFVSVQHPYVKDTVWFWGSMPYPKFQYAWLDK